MIFIEIFCRLYLPVMLHDTKLTKHVKILVCMLRPKGTL